MRVAITGASGLIGTRLVTALRERGDEVTALSRNPDRTETQLNVPAVSWDPLHEPAPTTALSGRDGVVHLAGEPVAQRWSTDAKHRIISSRQTGTRNLVAGLAATDPRPGTLVSSSAVGYYGPRGDEPIAESTPPSDDFLARTCVVWEQEADAAAQFGVRVVKIRTGVVLDRSGGALAKMLVPFRLGVGGPVAGGHQYLPWIHVDDVVGLYLKALDDPTWQGPYNASAPTPVTNRMFSRALGRTLRRPAVLPVPGLALQALYGEMASVVTQGQRALPERALAGGYSFRHPDLDEALADALA